MSELKPCPFCGSDAEIVTIQAFAWCNNIYIAQCASLDCKVSPGVKSIEKKEVTEAVHVLSGERKEK